MYKTYCTMKEFRNEKVYEGLGFEDLAIEYQRTGADDIIAEVYVRLFPAICQVANKFDILDEEDKAHFALTAIQRTLSMYRKDMKCKYTTYYIGTLTRSYIGKVNTKNCKKRVIWKYTQEMDHYDLENAIDQVISDPSAEMEYNSVYERDTISFIYTKLNLTDSEKVYIKMVLEGCPPREIKEALGITVNSVLTALKKDVKTKLMANPRAMELLYSS